MYIISYLHNMPYGKLPVWQTCKRSSFLYMLSLEWEEIWTYSSCFSSFHTPCGWQSHLVSGDDLRRATVGSACHTFLSSHTSQASEWASHDRRDGTSPSTGHDGHKLHSWWCSLWLSRLGPVLYSDCRGQRPCDWHPHQSLHLHLHPEWGYTANGCCLLKTDINSPFLKKKKMDGMV